MVSHIWPTWLLIQLNRLNFLLITLTLHILFNFLNQYFSITKFNIIQRTIIIVKFFTLFTPFILALGLHDHIWLHQWGLWFIIFCHEIKFCHSILFNPLNIFVKLYWGFYKCTKGNLFPSMIFELICNNWRSLISLVIVPETNWGQLKYWMAYLIWFHNNAAPLTGIVSWDQNCLKLESINCNLDIVAVYL